MGRTGSRTSHASGHVLPGPASSAILEDDVTASLREVPLGAPIGIELPRERAALQRA